MKLKYFRPQKHLAHWFENFYAASETFIGFELCDFGAKLEVRKSLRDIISRNEVVKVVFCSDS